MRLQGEIKDHIFKARESALLAVETYNRSTAPVLDPEIFGECQSMLMNFENLLCQEFYVYKEAWINFLIGKLSDETEYDNLFKRE